MIDVCMVSLARKAVVPAEFIQEPNRQGMGQLNLNELLSSSSAPPKPFVGVYGAL